MDQLDIYNLDHIKNLLQIVKITDIILNLQVTKLD